VILKFANKEDKSKKGSEIDKKNNSNKENKSKESSRINKENNSKSKND
jgi:hypothetical protein